MRGGRTNSFEFVAMRLLLGSPWVISPRVGRSRGGAPGLSIMGTLSQVQRNPGPILDPTAEE